MLSCCVQHPINYAVHPWQHSILVWLLLCRSGCSSPSTDELHVYTKDWINMWIWTPQKMLFCEGTTKLSSSKYRQTNITPSLLIDWLIDYTYFFCSCFCNNWFASNEIESAATARPAQLPNNYDYYYNSSSNSEQLNCQKCSCIYLPTYIHTHLLCVRLHSKWKKVFILCIFPTIKRWKTSKTFTRLFALTFVQDKLNYKTKSDFWK